MLALNRGVVDKPSTLQQDLSLDCDGDLHIVLPFAEKIRVNTYIDVLGDPQSHSEKNLKLYNKYESSVYTSVILFVTKVCCVF